MPHKLTRDKLQRGPIGQAPNRSALRLRCIRLGRFRLLSRHFMRGLRYWQAKG